MFHCDNPNCKKQNFAYCVCTCVQIVSGGLVLALNQVLWREVVLQWMNSQAFCKSILTDVCAPSQLNHIKNIDIYSKSLRIIIFK